MTTKSTLTDTESVWIDPDDAPDLSTPYWQARVATAPVRQYNGSVKQDNIDEIPDSFFKNGVIGIDGLAELAGEKNVAFLHGKPQTFEKPWTTPDGNVIEVTDEMVANMRPLIEMDLFLKAERFFQKTFHTLGTRARRRLIRHIKAFLPR
jgi:hypothetical protein